MTRGTRAPYIPADHRHIIRATLRFDSRDPEHRKIVAYLKRTGVADNVSVRCRKLVEVGYRAMKAERRLARALGSQPTTPLDGKAEHNRSEGDDE